jgi:pimeloyl-ACP methyl ester carboxylesterase
MPGLERNGVYIHYEQHGEGFPVLLFAPGGMRSSIAWWQRAPWNPVIELASSFRVIAIDQRNAGQSRAPVRASDGWDTYTADHIALLDHLEIDRCHLLGGCIGGSFSLGLMQAAPARVASAVLQQPIGHSGGNREVFFGLFDDWQKELRKHQPTVTDAVWSDFRERMYGGDFVFNVSRDFLRSCSTPMLVLMGNDVYHPSETSREIAALAPRAELIERWKDPEVVAETVKRVRAFLLANTPN